MLIMRAFYVVQADSVVAISINATTGEVIHSQVYAKDKSIEEIKQIIGEDHGIDNYFDISLETIV